MNVKKTKQWGGKRAGAGAKPQAETKQWSTTAITVKTKILLKEYQQKNNFDSIDRAILALLKQNKSILK